VSKSRRDSGAVTARRDKRPHGKIEFESDGAPQPFQTALSRRYARPATHLKTATQPGGATQASAAPETISGS